MPTPRSYLRQSSASTSGVGRLKAARIDMAGNYDPLFNLPSGTEDIESVFKTMRPSDPSHPGSFYAHHADNTTTANREPSDRKGKGQELQQRSGKTIYMDPNHVKAIAGIYQNTEMATKLVPLIKDGKYIDGVALQYMEDYGPKKAGSTIVQAPYQTKPAVGLNPVEISGSAESPKGSSGRNIHFGNAITEVHPKPARLSGKLGVGAALLGGAGAASAGEYRKAAGDVAESFLPPWLTPSETNLNEPELLARRNELFAQRKRSQEASWGGEGKRGVTMPDDYAAGGRVRLI